jgi:hypothetical protein
LESFLAIGLVRRTSKVLLNANTSTCQPRLKENIAARPARKEPIENHRKKNVGVSISATSKTTPKIIQPM